MWRIKGHPASFHGSVEIQTWIPQILVWHSLHYTTLDHNTKTNKCFKKAPEALFCLWYQEKVEGLNPLSPSNWAPIHLVAMHAVYPLKTEINLWACVTSVLALNSHLKQCFSICNLWCHKVAQYFFLFIIHGLSLNPSLWGGPTFHAMGYTLVEIPMYKIHTCNLDLKTIHVHCLPWTLWNI